MLRCESKRIHNAMAAAEETHRSSIVNKDKVKRKITETNTYLDGIKVVLLDIEGTTTPISFVKDTLFPYILENIKEYLETHYDDSECQEDIKALREQVDNDKLKEIEGIIDIPNSEAGKEDVLKAVVENVTWQMSSDRKTTSLKQLQGHMWRHAFKSGQVKSVIFEDVVDALKKLKDTCKVYIYSSGSVEAQKLLYGYSDRGDLMEYISGYYDTNIGAKIYAESYRNIAIDIDCKAEDILFLTDVSKESEAAAEAGLNTCIVVRPGNAALSEEAMKLFNQISSFKELFNDTEHC